MSWKFFIGSSIVVAAALIKVGVPIFPIAAGLVTAGLLTWKLQRRTNRFPR
ncbi:MAG TPA: hypothetical protein VFU28_20960 [Vicinamibacterales bacterium]|nr:hypothetical protein [Vicinamibacterales bacterium]